MWLWELLSAYNCKQITTDPYLILREEGFILSVELPGWRGLKMHFNIMVIKIKTYSNCKICQPLPLLLTIHAGKITPLDYQRESTLTSSAFSAIWSRIDSEEARLILPRKTYKHLFAKHKLPHTLHTSWFQQKGKAFTFTITDQKTTNAVFRHWTEINTTITQFLFCNLCFSSCISFTWRSANLEGPFCFHIT